MTKRRPANTRSVKHQHGTPNPIILSEQKTLLATVDRALQSSGNAQVIGRNGEIPLRQFFNRYLPFTLKAASGHFVSPGGCLSPQVDLFVLDARYPLLAENSDGSVLAMLHAVLTTIEVKTRMTTRDVKRAWINAIEIMRIANQVKDYGKPDAWASVHTQAIAYRIGQRLERTEATYVKAARPDEAGFDLNILCVPESDQAPGSQLGADLHMEPVRGRERFLPTCRLSHTLLSDVYYRLVQDSYYTLAHRNWSSGDIGQHIMDYMAWATCSWGEYEARLNQRPNKRLHAAPAASNTQMDSKRRERGQRG